MHDGFEQIGHMNWIGLEICEVIANMLVEIPCCYIILYFLFPVYLWRGKYFHFIIGCVLLFITSAGVYYLDHLLFAHRIHEFFGLRFSNQEYFYSSLINLLIFFPVPIALTLGIKMLKSWYLEQQHFLQLRQETTAAEMQLLKAQVHPHFLFNTLNNIYSFALDGSSQTGILLEKLSQTMQYMMTECQASVVPLENELKMIMDYIALEKVRYGDRLHIEIGITGSVKSKTISPLLLIPFTENSFKHGASRILGQAWIKVSVRISDDMLCFSIENSKPPKDKPFLAKGGIGLANVKKRLNLLYPKRHSLFISDMKEKFDVRMIVPLANSNGV
jgi:LytS/YehU family sensor histidine kinase